MSIMCYNSLEFVVASTYSVCYSMYALPVALHVLFSTALIASATPTTNVSDLLSCLCSPLHNALSQVFSNSVVIQVPAFKVHQPLCPWGMFPSDAYPVVYGKQALKRIISESVPLGWQI